MFSIFFAQSSSLLWSSSLWSSLGDSQFVAHPPPMILASPTSGHIHQCQHPSIFTMTTHYALTFLNLLRELTMHYALTFLYLLRELTMHYALTFLYLLWELTIHYALTFLHLLRELTMHYALTFENACLASSRRSELYSRIRVDVCVHMYVCMYVCMCVCVCACMHTHT